MSTKVNLSEPIRRLALALALAVLFTAVVPVTAQASGNDSGWTELLEFTSVQENGSNFFTINGTNGLLTIPLYGQYHLRKVDILLWNPSGQRPSSATCTAGGKTTNLDVLAIGGNLTRIVGYIPESVYTSIRIDLKKTTTTSQTYEVLSYKVTALGVQEFQISSSVYVESYGTTGTYTTNYNIPLWCDPSDYYTDGANWLARVTVSEWEKYDSLSIWGSATSASIESIRASITSTALPIVVDYIDAESYEMFVDGDPASSVTAEFGKYLYHVYIDLSGVDRSLTTQPLYLYITGSYDITVQAYFNCQYVNGSVSTADTTNVTWWNRFTSFFTGLFGGDSTKADDFESEMVQQGQDVQDAVDQIDTVTRPALDDVEVDIGQIIEPSGSDQLANLMGQLFNNYLITSMVTISLMVALASFIIFGKR